MKSGNRWDFHRESGKKQKELNLILIKNEEMLELKRIKSCFLIIDEKYFLTKQL